MSTDELVDLFAQNGIEQERVIFKEQVAKYKKVFGQMAAIDAELKRRGAAARLALTRLYEHPNMQVRLQAARLTIAVSPAGARRVLEAIALSGRMPQAADARGKLRDLVEGVTRPD
jgi:hypothetical protein